MRTTSPWMRIVLTKTALELHKLSLLHAWKESCVSDSRCCCLKSFLRRLFGEKVCESRVAQEQRWKQSQKLWLHLTRTSERLFSVAPSRSNSQFRRHFSSVLFFETTGWHGVSMFNLPWNRYVNPLINGLILWFSKMILRFDNKMRINDK